jgi:DNA-binding transcriptional LysR family regulator
LRLLRVFMSVVEHRGFAKAQYELNRSTSSISTTMSQLETPFDVVLCYRGRGGFSLTPKGAKFHVEAHRLDAAISTAQLKMKEFKYHPFYRERHKLYCASAHPLFGVKRIGENDLGNHRSATTPAS